VLAVQFNLKTAVEPFLSVQPVDCGQKNPTALQLTIFVASSFGASTYD
jgi:hypothetical protein